MMLCRTFRTSMATSRRAESATFSATSMPARLRHPRALQGAPLARVRPLSFAQPPARAHARRQTGALALALAHAHARARAGARARARARHHPPHRHRALAAARAPTHHQRVVVRLVVVTHAVASPTSSGSPTTHPRIASSGGRGPRKQLHPRRAMRRHVLASSRAALVTPEGWLASQPPTRCLGLSLIHI